MSKEEIKVKITAHKDFLVIETIDPTADDNFVPVGGQRIGSVLMGTEKYLGMSNEAFDLMKTVKSSGDDIGDIDTFDSVKGQCFSWLGPLKRLVEVSKSECSRTGIIDLKYIPIKNEVPLDAYEAITRQSVD